MLYQVIVTLSDIPSQRFNAKGENEGENLSEQIKM